MSKLLGVSKEVLFFSIAFSIVLLVMVVESIYNFFVSTPHTPHGYG